MYESYIKEIPIIDLNQEQSDNAIIESILESQQKLELAHKNIEYARGELIDYYAYQIKAEEAKINYLLRQAKDKKITVVSEKTRKKATKQIAFNE